MIDTTIPPITFIGHETTVGGVTPPFGGLIVPTEQALNDPRYGRLAIFTFVLTILDNLKVISELSNAPKPYFKGSTLGLEFGDRIILKKDGKVEDMVRSLDLSLTPQPVNVVRIVRMNLDGKVWMPQEK